MSCSRGCMRPSLKDRPRACILSLNAASTRPTSSLRTLLFGRSTSSKNSNCGVLGSSNSQTALAPAVDMPGLRSMALRARASRPCTKFLLAPGGGFGVAAASLTTGGSGGVMRDRGGAGRISVITTFYSIDIRCYPSGMRNRFFDIPMSGVSHCESSTVRKLQ
jgi:hypothetical protein